MLLDILPQLSENSPLLADAHRELTEVTSNLRNVLGVIDTDNADNVDPEEVVFTVTKSLERIGEALQFCQTAVSILESQGKLPEGVYEKIESINTKLHEMWNHGNGGNQ
jgi:putative heme iron utilization protein